MDTSSALHTGLDCVPPMENLSISATTSDAVTAKSPTPSSTGMLALSNKLLLKIVANVPFSKQAWKNLKLVNRRFHMIMSTQSLPDDIITAQYGMAIVLGPPQGRVNSKQGLLNIAEEHVLIGECSQRMATAAKAPYNVCYTGLILWAALQEWKAEMINTSTSRRVLNRKEKARVGGFVGRLLQRLPSEAISLLRYLAVKLSEALAPQFTPGRTSFEIPMPFQVSYHVKFEYFLLFLHTHEYARVLSYLSSALAQVTEYDTAVSIFKICESVPKPRPDDNLPTGITLLLTISWLCMLKDANIELTQFGRPPFQLGDILDLGVFDDLDVTYSVGCHLERVFGSTESRSAVLARVDLNLESIGAVFREASETAWEWSRRGQTVDMLKQTLNECLEVLNA